jgi:diadenosine tetraphosphate (Ap4A) HIT family hydrolase
MRRLSSPNNTVCCLCAQLAGDQAHDLIHRSLGQTEYQRRVIYETSTTALIPSLGPLAPGHSLLCPQEHVRSIACAPGIAQDAMRSAVGLCTRVLESVYDSPVHRFEHGNSRYGDGIACSVEHAHLHLVPFRGDVWSLVRGLGEWQVLAGGVAALPTATNGLEYLYYESPAGEAYLWLTDGRPIPSQLLRRVFAEASGQSSRWNWRTDPAPQVADATYRAVSQALVVS